MVRLQRAALALLLFASLAGQADPRLLDSRRLFFIRSNYNRNEVVYEALLDNGVFDIGRPVRGYWILHMKGDALENFSALEDRLAFGLVIESATPAQVIFHLRAARDRKVTARIEGEHVSASALIRGVECELVGLIASVDARGMIPSVNYVELIGHARDDGRLITERVTR